TPRYEDLAQLCYTRMVIEESMRLFPPAHIISRQPVADDEVLGHRIPAGSEVMILPWLLHRKPALWENPDCFDPERFAPERVARAFCLHSVWCRSAHLHWCGLRHGQSYVNPPHHCTALSTAAEAWLSGRAAGLDYATAALRFADDPGAA